MLPFSYAARNLFRSKTRLLQTIGGSALVVLLVMTAVAINAGMARVLSASGSEFNVILLGSGSEESVQRSEVPDSAAGIASTSVRGISERLGVRAVSPEIHYMNHIDLGDGRRAQTLVRDILSGIFMLIEDQYGVGDTISVLEVEGTVEKVGLRVTTVRDGQGTLWYLRNGEILKVGNQSQSG